MLNYSFCHARNHHLKAPLIPQLHLSQPSSFSAALFTALVWFPALFHFHLVSLFCFFHDSSLPPSVSVLFLLTQPLFHFSLLFHFWLWLLFIFGFVCFHFQQLCQLLLILNHRGSVAASTGVLLKPTPTGDNIDIPRQWNSLKDKNDKMVTYDFCKKTSTWGISRAKRHQKGRKGNASCIPLSESTMFKSDKATMTESLPIHLFCTRDETNYLSLKSIHILPTCRLTSISPTTSRFTIFLNKIISTSIYFYSITLPTRIPLNC